MGVKDFEENMNRSDAVSTIYILLGRYTEVLLENVF